MPLEREYNTRDAGNDIANAGLADDVIPAKGRDISDRGNREKAKRDSERNRREEIDDDDSDRNDDDGNEEDDDAGSGSNRDGESEDDGNEDREQSDESEEDDNDESRAQSDDKSHEITVNGEKQRVTLSELKAGYQRNEDYHRKTQGLAQERRSFVEAHAKVADGLKAAQQNIAGTLTSVLDVLVGSVNSERMQTLRQTNPDQWTRERMAIQDQREQIGKILQDSNQEQERLRQESSKQNGQDHNALVQHTIAEMQRLTKGEWTQPGKDGKTGAKRLLEHLVTDRGFKPEEVSNVLDPRMLLIAEEARKYRQMIASGDKAKLKQAKTPPPKPSQGRGSEISRRGSKETARSKSYRQSRQKAKETGNMRDAGDAINRLFGFEK